MFNKVVILIFLLAISSISCAENSGIEQHYYGSTNVCNASEAYGCSGFVTYEVYKKYIQEYGEGAIVCNSSASNGCTYGGHTAKRGCISINGNRDEVACY
jgi:hypothetical protein